MSEHMKARHTEKGSSPQYFKIIIESPKKKKQTSFVSEKVLAKLEIFLSKYSEAEPIEWNELASERIKKYKKAGLALRGARYREGISQKELAKRSGVSQENISRIENGKRGVGKHVAEKLANVLNIRPELLNS